MELFQDLVYGKIVCTFKTLHRETRGLENGAIIIGGSSIKKLTTAINIALEDKPIDNINAYNKNNISKIILKSVISYLEYYK